MATASISLYPQWLPAGVPPESGDPEPRGEPQAADQVNRRRQLTAPSRARLPAGDALMRPAASRAQQNCVNMTEKGSRPPIQRQACNPAHKRPWPSIAAGGRGSYNPRECRRRGGFHGAKTCGPGSGRQSTARPHRGQVGMFGLFLRVVIIWALLLASVWLGENRCRRHGDTLDRAVKYILICM